MTCYKILIATCFLVGMISSLELNILGAAFGKADVTDQVRSAVNNDSLSISASNSVFNDTWPGNKKSLVVVYQYDDYKPTVVVAQEDTDVTITQDNATLQEWDSDYSSDFGILGAAYGLADETQTVQSFVGEGLAAISVSNSVFTDTWPGSQKSLVVVYLNSSGSPAVNITTEGESLDTSIFLPELNIIKAAYGLGDVTDVVRDIVERQGGKTLDTDVSNKVFNDTWPGTQKALVVVYQFGGDDYQMTIHKEDENVSLSYL